MSRCFLCIRKDVTALRAGTHCPVAIVHYTAAVCRCAADRRPKALSHRPERPEPLAYQKRNARKQRKEERMLGRGEVSVGESKPVGRFHVDMRDSANERSVDVRMYVWIDPRFNEKSSRTGLGAGSLSGPGSYKTKGEDRRAMIEESPKTEPATNATSERNRWNDSSGRRGDPIILRGS